MTEFRTKSCLQVEYVGSAKRGRWGENRIGVVFTVPQWVARLAARYIWWRREQ